MNQHENTKPRVYELTESQQFSVQFIETVHYQAGPGYVNDYGIWNVVKVLMYPNRPHQFIIEPTDRSAGSDLTLPVTANQDELRVTFQTGHRKTCIAKAMISGIATLADEPAVSTTDFIDAVQANITGDDCLPTSLYEMTVEGLNEGVVHCICLTTDGLV